MLDSLWHSTGLAVSLGAALFMGCGPAIDIVAVRGQETCDGKDEDGDGIIDDVDVDGDGLCDCLRAGVHGYPGASRSMDQLRGLMHARAVATEILADQELSAELLSGLDVLIIQDVQDGQARNTVGQAGVGMGIGRAYSQAEVQAVADWVAAGGGLMTLTGYVAASGETTNTNRLLAPFGMSYGAAAVLDAFAGPEIPVTHWNSVHPLASGVTRVGFANGHPVSGGTLIAWEPNPGAYDVARAVEWGRGHVFVWGDEWISYDPEWTNPNFQVRRLWLNAFKWLTAADRCQVPIP